MDPTPLPMSVNVVCEQPRSPLSNVVYVHANLMICVYDREARVTISQQNCHCRTARATAQNSKHIMCPFAKRCTLTSITLSKINFKSSKLKVSSIRNSLKWFVYFTVL